MSIICNRNVMNHEVAHVAPNMDLISQLFWYLLYTQMTQAGQWTMPGIWYQLPTDEKMHLSKLIFFKIFRKYNTYKFSKFLLLYIGVTGVTKFQHL